MTPEEPLTLPGALPGGEGEAIRAPGADPAPLPARLPRGERWLPAPGWAAYEVSSRGRVRSVPRRLANGQETGGQLLRPVADKDGYLYVILRDGPRRWRVHVARLVLFAFAGWPEAGAEACHRNGRRRDCRLANLYWGTKPENRADRERHRRERLARASVTAVNEVKQAGTEETACCPVPGVAGVSRC